MKKLFLMLLVGGFALIGKGQEDTSLINRINIVLSFTQAKDVEKVLDYTYPKLFTIASRDAMIAAMKSTLESEDFNIELDSLRILKIFPIFTINDTNYVKVKHSMLMRMRYIEPYDSTQKEEKEFMVSLMSERFGEKNVRFDPVANSLNISMTPDMIGIKTKTAAWTFVNLEEDNPAMLNMLFNKKVIDKLKEFN